MLALTSGAQPAQPGQMPGSSTGPLTGQVPGNSSSSGVQNHPSWQEQNASTHHALLQQQWCAEPSQRGRSRIRTRQDPRMEVTEQLPTPPAVLQQTAPTAPPTEPPRLPRPRSQECESCDRTAGRHDRPCPRCGLLICWRCRRWGMPCMCPREIELCHGPLIGLESTSRRHWHAMYVLPEVLAK